MIVCYRAIVIARGESEYKYVCGVSGVLREERKAFFQYRPGLDYRRGEYDGKSRVEQSTGKNRAT